MQINIITLGNRMPQWVSQGYNEYAKRIASNVTLKLLEIPLEKRAKNSPINQIIQKEAQRILSAVPPRTRLIALDLTGKLVSSGKLALELSAWLQSGQDVSFMIGGPDGLSSECLSKADEIWSLSQLTFPHPIVRIILAEQLYRAWSIYNNHPYHR